MTRPICAAIPPQYAAAGSAARSSRLAQARPDEVMTEASSPSREEPNDINDGVGDVDSALFYQDVTCQAQGPSVCGEYRCGGP